MGFLCISGFCHHRIGSDPLFAIGSVRPLAPHHQRGAVRGVHLVAVRIGLPQAHRFGSHLLLTSGSDRGHLTGSVRAPLREATRIASRSLDRIGSYRAVGSESPTRAGQIGVFKHRRIGVFKHRRIGSDRTIGSDRPYFHRSGPVRMISCSSSSEQFTPFDGVFDKSNTSNQS